MISTIRIPYSAVVPGRFCAHKKSSNNYNQYRFNSLAPSLHFLLVYTSPRLPLVFLPPFFFHLLLLDCSSSSSRFAALIPRRRPQSHSLACSICARGRSLRITLRASILRFSSANISPPSSSLLIYIFNARHRRERDENVRLSPRARFVSAAAAASFGKLSFFAAWLLARLTLVGKLFFPSEPVARVTRARVARRMISCLWPN